MLTLPRPDYSTAGVARGLEAKFGNATAVTCTADSGGWTCVAHDLTETRTACQLTSALVGGSEATQRPHGVVLTAADCAQARASQLAVAKEDGKLLATALTPQAQASDARPSLVVAATAPDTDDWEQAWDWLTR